MKFARFFGAMPLPRFIGSSVRGSLALERAVRAWALLEGRQLTRAAKQRSQRRKLRGRFHEVFR